MPDFSHLLQKPSGEIKRPVPLPAGTGYGFIENYEFGESREKKTPYCRVNIQHTRMDASVPAELLEGIDQSKKRLRQDFFLTEDALYRFNEFLDSLGIDNGGGLKPLGDRVPEMKGKPVMYEIVNTTSEDGKETYNNVRNTVGHTGI